MKKLLIICSILSIIVSLSLSFSCESDAFCCQDQHSQSADCPTCVTHAESVYTLLSFDTLFVASPSFLLQIFFGHIHIKTMDFISLLERPPAGLV